MRRGAYKCDMQIEETTSWSSNTMKDRLYRRKADLCKCGYAPIQNWMGYQSRRQRKESICDSIWCEGVEWKTKEVRSQVKRELWGIISVVKADHDYLIGTEVIIETNCLPILGMISGSATLDIAMLWWIAYIKSLNPEIRHVAGKYNVVTPYPMKKILAWTSSQLLVLKYWQLSKRKIIKGSS